MLLKEIVLRKQDAFDREIQTWAQNNNIVTKQFDGSISLYDTAEAVILFHEDYNISKENKGVVELFNEHGKFSQQIDVNGTLVASVSSFIFWLENHKPERLLFIGNDKLPKNEKFIKFLNHIAEKI